MSNYLRQMVVEAVRGIGQVLVLSHGRSYVRPGTNSFRGDARRLHHDARRVARGFKTQFNKK